MKIMRRAEFLDLPAGVLYARGVPWAFDNIMVKGETLRHPGGVSDWYERSWCWVFSENSNEAFKLLQSALEHGKSVPINDAEGRNGLFEPDDIFMVFERADLELIAADVQNALGTIDSAISLRHEHAA